MVGIMTELLLIFLAAFVSLISAAYLGRWVLKRPAGNARMTEIAGYISDGTRAYLKRQYRVIGIIAIVIAVIFYFIFNLNTSLTFLAGAVFSVLAGYAGMYIATKANVRVAESARKGVSSALSTAFAGGSVMGFAVMGLGLFGVALFQTIFGDPSMFISFGFGASFVALFARLGGGIFTKAADIGADLVGKIEKGIPEDDPRNPAVIADNVGDNVGDVAGMGADLFESFVASMIAAMVIAIPLGQSSIILPLLLGAAGVLAMIVGTIVVRRGKDPSKSANNGFLSSAIAGVILFFLVISYLGLSMNIFYASVVGVVVMVLIGRVTDYYTSYDYSPTLDVAKASITGPATNILAGMSGGLMSTALPVLIVAFATIISFQLAGMFGIAIAAVGMLSLAGFAIAIDSTGAISDNAGGIVQMSKLPPKVRKVTDKLDSAGNTAAAIAKGAAIGSAALTALALFGAFLQSSGLTSINVANPTVMFGLFIGGVMPFVFSGMAIGAVSRAAFKMVEEVRRQFRTIKGIMSGKAKPNYERAVDISTQAALKEMIAPALLVILVPLVLGFTLGPQAVGGMLVGALLSGFLLALFLSNSGAMWDNAKKYIETGKLGGKGSYAHKAAVIGDTVGDPSKDTAGPSINILIKLMSTISLLFAMLFVKYAIF